MAAYNIRIELQDAATFFGVDQLPMPVVTPEEILNVVEAKDALSIEGHEFLCFLGFAMASPPGEESAVDDFVVRLFRACGYCPRGRIARSRKDLIHLRRKQAREDRCLYRGR